MKIKVLVENTATAPLECEHGLSLLIEFQEERILLDAGSTDLFLRNAERMGVHLADIKVCVLSHGHYDHAGGFAAYLQQNPEAKLYMMKYADGEFYSGKDGFHAIGIPHEVLEAHRSRFVFIDSVTELKEHIYLVPHSTAGLEEIGMRTKLYKKVGEELLPDDFGHELSLVYDTEQGLVVFNSCSHGGVQNIISEVQKVLPNKKVYAFIGGLHMKGDVFTEEEIAEMAKYMQKAGVRYLYTGHCTGQKAFEILKEQGGDMVQALTSGMVIEI